MQSGEFTKLKLKQYAKVQDRETSEAKYWKSFSLVKEDTHQASPTCIHFNPVSPRSFIVSASVNVSLYDSLTDKVQRAYSRFNDDAFSAHFRRDGKLIVAGEKTGIVKVFDVQTKAMLRQLEGHTAATRCCRWSSDGVSILSASDDKSILRWDLATSDILWGNKSVHTDYVRALDTSPVSSDVFVTGSYDHTVCLWDSRAQSPSRKMPHSKPVESCLFTNSGTMLLTASGSEVKVFDVIGGCKLLHTFNNHQKNVTSLCMDGTATRVLSAGLDGHVKVYNLQTMQVAHGMKFGSPLTSIGMAQDNSKLVIGLVDGSLMMRNKRDDTGTNAPDAAAEDLGFIHRDSARLRQSRLYKGAGNVYTSEETGYNGNGETTAVVSADRTTRLQAYEKQLKKFNYQEALDSALKTRNPVTIVTVLEELARRNGLTISLAGRDETTLEPLVSFCVRYVNHPKYAKLIVQVVHTILDTYASVLSHSDAIDELFVKLHKQVRSEVGFQRQILRVMGSLDGIISAATMPTVTNNGHNEL